MYFRKQIIYFRKDFEYFRNFFALFVKNLVYSRKYFVHYFWKNFLYFKKTFDEIQEIFSTFQKTFGVFKKILCSFFEERFLAFFRERYCVLQKRFCVFRETYFAHFGHRKCLTLINFSQLPLKNLQRVVPEEEIFDLIYRYHNIQNNHSSAKTTYYQVSYCLKLLVKILIFFSQLLIV